MILRKGKPCVAMPVTGSGKGFVPDDSKPLSGYIKFMLVGMYPT